MNTGPPGLRAILSSFLNQVQTDQAAKSRPQTTHINWKCEGMKVPKRDLVDRLPESHVAAPYAKCRHNFVGSVWREIQLALDGIDVDPRMRRTAVDHHVPHHRASIAVPNGHRRHQEA